MSALVELAFLALAAVMERAASPAASGGSSALVSPLSGAVLVGCCPLACTAAGSGLAPVMWLPLALCAGGGRHKRDGAKEKLLTPCTTGKPDNPSRFARLERARSLALLLSCLSVRSSTSRAMRHCQLVALTARHSLQVCNHWDNNQQQTCQTQHCQSLQA